jgi:DNA-binding MarR family transcriptional regulator
MSDLIIPPISQFLRESCIRGGMDLMFFANTRHLKKADDRLAALKLGRAHHRVLYFVARRPDLSIGELLAILGITKQSGNRTLKELVARGLMTSRPGERDRRQRLLRLTEPGSLLEREIFDDLHANMQNAYAAAGGVAVAGFWAVMQQLMGVDARRQFQTMYLEEG